jgi:hypothetical protein
MFRWIALKIAFCFVPIWSRIGFINFVYWVCFTCAAALALRSVLNEIRLGRISGACSSLALIIAKIVVPIWSRIGFINFVYWVCFTCAAALALRSVLNEIRLGRISGACGSLALIIAKIIVPIWSRIGFINFVYWVCFTCTATRALRSVLNEIRLGWISGACSSLALIIAKIIVPIWSRIGFINFVYWVCFTCAAARTLRGGLNEIRLGWISGACSSLALINAKIIVPIWGRCWASICHTILNAAACAFGRVFPMR